jgi:hypothetical protein
MAILVLCLAGGSVIVGCILIEGFLAVVERLS